MAHEKGRIAREFAIRASNVPGDAEVRWDITPSLATSSREPPDGINMSGVHAVAVRIPEDAQKATVRVGVAAGAWQTEGECDGTASAVGGAKGGTVFSKPEAKDGNTIITVSHDITDAQVRAIAVAQDGKEHVGNACGTLSAGKVTQVSLTFVKLPLTDIKSFRLQSRLYQWVEFRNVSLQSGQKTDVQIAQSGTVRRPYPDYLPPYNSTATQARHPKETALQFGPARELVVNLGEGKEGVGLDAVGGRLVDLPKELLLDTDATRWSPQQERKWLADNNVDLLISPALAAEASKLAAVPNEHWDNVTRKELRSALESATPGALPGAFVGSVVERSELTYLMIQTVPPVTFAFQTRNGQLGILQVIRFTQEPSGMRIRYKLLQKPSQTEAPTAVSADGAAPTTASDAAADKDKLIAGLERVAVQGQSQGSFPRHVISAAVQKAIAAADDVQGWKPDRDLKPAGVFPNAILSVSLEEVKAQPAGIALTMKLTCKTEDSKDGKSVTLWEKTEQIVTFPAPQGQRPEAVKKPTNPRATEALARDLARQVREGSVKFFREFVADMRAARERGGAK